jgi:hypothetical protein
MAKRPADVHLPCPLIPGFFLYKLSPIAKLPFFHKKRLMKNTSFFFLTYPIPDT